VPPQIAAFDVWVTIAAAPLLVLFAATGWRVERWEGGAFLAAYSGYLLVQLMPTFRAWRGPRRLPGLGDQDVTGGLAKQVLGHAAECRVRNARAPMGPGHE
jgi:hypothetical protein